MSKSDPKFLTLDEAFRRVEAISPGGGMGGIVAAMEAAGCFGGEIVNGEVVGMNHDEWREPATESASEWGRAR